MSEHICDKCKHPKIRCICSWPQGKQVASNDLLYAKLVEYFRLQRFSDTNHIGLGDIRLTIGQQEHILKMVAEETGCEYIGI